MRSPFLYVTSAVVVAAISACASSSGGSGATPSVSMQAASGAIGPASVQWSGKFKSVQQQTAALDQRALSVASGSVLLTAPDANVTRAQISVSGQSDDAVELHWALAPGACRSGSIPLLAVNEFPEIRMAHGHGELDQVISLTLPMSGSYHVNVYTGDGSDESDVMTCAELKLGRRGE